MPVSNDPGAAAAPAPAAGSNLGGAPTLGALARPFATAHCLAGFLDADSLLQHLPTLAALPPQVGAAIRERLGRAQALPDEPHAGRPQFDRVTEPSVLALLEFVVQQQSVAAGLDNLVGFEWVEIAPLIAGRLVTDAEPPIEAHPRLNDIDALARFCMLSCATLPAVMTDATEAPAGGPVRLISSVATDLVLVTVNPERLRDADGHEAVMVTMQYLIRPAVRPIRVLVADGRAVALTGLGRLAVLLRAGVERALCVVSYGYGIDALLALSTTPSTMLQASRPPLVADLFDSALTITVPVRPEVTLASLQPQVVRLG